MSAAAANAAPIPIYLLKTKSTPHDGYEEFFSATKLEGGREFAPTFVPVLEHTLLEPGLDTVRQLLRSRKINDSGDEGTYGGLIFTSQRAVEAFATLVEEGAPPSSTTTTTDTTPETWPHLSTIPIYTVGPATTRALRSIPSHPPLQIHGSHTGNGEALAQHILTHYHPPPSPSSSPSSSSPPLPHRPPLLFLVGETRRAIIPDTLSHPALPPPQRIPVHEVEVYGTTTQPAFPASLAALLASSAAAPVRWIVVFSPTGCEAALREVGLLDGGDDDDGNNNNNNVEGRAVRAAGRRNNSNGSNGSSSSKDKKGQRQTYIATIGPTTRDFLRTQFGFEADVCAEVPSPEGVGEAIRRFMVGLG